MGIIIDVSKHQGTIDWAAVKPQIDAAILRCGFGTNMNKNDDPTFVRNASECERLGIPYGVYLYSYAKTTVAARSEAEHVLRLLKDRKVSGHVWFDSEQKGTEGAAKACAQVFCDRIQAAGYKAGLYTGESWFKNFIKNFNYPLWIAKYGKNDGAPHAKPSIGCGYHLWQFTSRKAVNGIRKPVDASVICDGASVSSTPVKAGKGPSAANKKVVLKQSDPNMYDVYRLYNPAKGQHLLTISPQEGNTLQDRGWEYEGVSFHAPKQGNPIFRLCNPNSGEHFYTRSADEKSVLIRSGWNDEGTAFCEAEDGTPAYRLYNPNAGQHVYTANTDEVEKVIRAGWEFEGEAFRVIA